MSIARSHLVEYYGHSAFGKYGRRDGCVAHYNIAILVYLPTFSAQSLLKIIDSCWVARVSIAVGGLCVTYCTGLHGA